MYCPFRQLASIQTRHVEKMDKCNLSEHAQRIESSDSVTVDTVVCEPENETVLSRLGRGMADWRSRSGNLFMVAMQHTNMTGNRSRQRSPTTISKEKLGMGAVMGAPVWYLDIHKRSQCARGVLLWYAMANGPIRGHLGQHMMDATDNLDVGSLNTHGLQTWCTLLIRVII